MTTSSRPQCNDHPVGYARLPVRTTYRRRRRRAQPLSPKLRAYRILLVLVVGPESHKHPTRGNVQVFRPHPKQLANPETGRVISRPRPCVDTLHGRPEVALRDGLEFLPGLFQLQFHPLHGLSIARPRPNWTCGFPASSFLFCCSISESTHFARGPTHRPRNRHPRKSKPSRKCTTRVFSGWILSLSCPSRICLATSSARSALRSSLQRMSKSSA